MSEMLPLDSPKWRELNDAYGSARDVPALLEDLDALDTVPEEAMSEPIYSLWSGLYHQEDVYSASYAAFPHLVRIASQ
ncbi:MAG: hypothetical protein AAGJ87_16670 [Pseudomonadota bacterium]